MTLRLKFSHGKLLVLLLLGLILSLSVNVFLVSYMFGQGQAVSSSVHDWPSVSIEDVHRDSGFSEGSFNGEARGQFLRVARSLSPEGRRVFMRSFRPKMQDIRGLRSEIAKAREALETLSAHENFSREAYDRALQELETKQLRIKDMIVGIVSDAMEDLSAEDRRIIVEHQREMMRIETDAAKGQ